MQALAILMFLATAAAAPSMAEAAVEAGCGLDRYEPNDVRSRAKSTRGKRVEARVCGDDADWYYVKLEAGSTIVVHAEHAAEDPLRVELYPPRSRKPQGEVSREGGSTLVSYRVRETGKHRIRVSSSDGGAASYAFELRPGS